MIFSLVYRVYSAKVTVCCSFWGRRKIFQLTRLARFASERWEIMGYRWRGLDELPQCSIQIQELWWASWNRADIVEGKFRRHTQRPAFTLEWSSTLFQFTVAFLRQKELLCYGSYGGRRERSEIACRKCLYRRQTMASVEFSLFHRLSARKCMVVALVCTSHYFDNRILQYSDFVSKY